MIIEEVFAKRKEARSWEEYHPHELAEMLECALLHIITLEVQATHLTKRALDLPHGGMLCEVVVEEDGGTKIYPIETASQ